MAAIIDGLGGAPVDYRAQSFARQLWRFSRPHTIIGTTLSLVALWAMAHGLGRGGASGVGTADLTDPIPAGGLLLAWVACLGANVYIVGLNQLTDVPLDRINKPYLPLASGAWTRRTGWTVALVGLVASVAATAASASAWLWWTVGLSLALGTAYSLPPTRLKRFPFWAAFCIVAVRSLIVNLLLFAHVADWSGGLAELPELVWLLAVVMFAFAIAIAWFKDLPDVAGDATFAVRTLPVRLGARRVLRVGMSVLLLALAGVSVYAGRPPGRSPLSLYQGLVIVGLAVAAVRLDLTEATSIRRFYLTLWGWFFVEYAAFAAAAWLARPA